MGKWIDWLLGRGAEVGNRIREKTRLLMNLIKE